MSTFEPIHDGYEAVQIMRAIGYDQARINMYLKARGSWMNINRDGLIEEWEMARYWRVMATQYLKGYRAFRHTNPVLAASQMRRYLACREEMQ